MNKLARIIQGLDHEELLLLQKDMDSGTIEKLISARLQELQEKHAKTCPVCGALVDPKTALRLEFGTPDLRRQAFFDAKDCLQFFMEHNLPK